MNDYLDSVGVNFFDFGLDQWFSKSSPGTSGGSRGPLAGLPCQNYFHNNIKLAFLLPFSYECRSQSADLSESVFSK